MKKTMKVLLAAFLFTGILQGCSSNNNETTGKENQSDTCLLYTSDRTRAKRYDV